MTHNPKLIGVPTQLLTKPLTEALRGNAAFQIVEESRPNIAKQLQEQSLGAALISPLDYAKESSDYRIVPKVAAVSGGNGSIVLRFREGTRKITTLAVDPSFALEIILAKIVLAEQFELEPKVVPLIASAEVMLQKADAALLAGDAALRERGATQDIIDIVEEWNELTDLPFVHAIWCGREGDLTHEEILSIQQAAEKGAAGIRDILAQYEPGARDAASEYMRGFSYTMDDAVKSGLAEFMKFLYYHGILPDVPDVNFYREEDAKNDSLLDVSPN